MSRIAVGELNVDAALYALVKDEIAPDTGVDAEAFWRGLEEIVRDLGAKNRRLLEKRDVLQAKIDAWHKGRESIDGEAYRAFLQEIGYLLPEGDHFQVLTNGVDPEVATVAGPQLVVPVDNARYCLNAANARWGSLYDALYGTDVIPEDDGADKGTAYNPVRGEKVIARANQFLDETVPLSSGSYAAVTAFVLHEKDGQKVLVAEVDGRGTGLSDPHQFVGYAERDGVLSSVLLAHNGLHVEIQIDP